MDYFNNIFSISFLQGLQNFLIALVVLFVGWILAKIISNMVKKLSKKLKLDERLFGDYQNEDNKVDTYNIIRKVVYYILMVIVFVIFFNMLNLNMIAGPLSNLIATFLNFIPAVLKALLILLFAFVLASVVKWLIEMAGRKLNLNKFFSKIPITEAEEYEEDEEDKKHDKDEYNIVEKIAKVIFYLIMFLFIPGVLDALNIQGVSEPFTGLLATILSFIPKLIAAALIFIVGWFIAKIIKMLIVNLLKAVGSESLVDKLKLTKLFKETTLADFVGTIVFVLIIIPVTIAALEQLELTAITGPAVLMLNNIMNMLPNIFIAVILVLIGIWLGKLIGEFVADLLQRLGFDGLVSRIQLGSLDTVETRMTPSSIVGYIVQVLIVFFLAVQAFNLVGLEFLVVIASAITAYLPNVLAAVLILFVALIIASIVEKVLLNVLSGPAINILAMFAKYAILTLAIFMALSQLGIAKSIVNAAFILILGGLALAFGIAFGLGGKEFASKYLEKFDKTLNETGVKEYQLNNNAEKKVDNEINNQFDDDVNKY